MRTQQRLQQVLTELGARLKRQHKHRVYEFPNGKTFVTAKSPSDVRGEANAIADAKRAAGVERAVEAVVGERRERKTKPGRAGVAPWSAPVTPMASALAKSGVLDQQMREDVADLRRRVEILTQRADGLATAIDGVERLWLVRVARWLSRLGEWT